MSVPSDEEVFGTIAFLNEVRLRYPEAISFAPGAPVLPGIDRDQLIEAIDRFAGRDWSSLLSYGPSQGVIGQELGEALAVGLGFRPHVDEIAVTVGAQEALLLLLRALSLHQEGTLGIVSPAFPGIWGAARFLGVKTLEIPEREDGLHVADLDDACRRASETPSPMIALYVAPDYSNPSGSVMSLANRVALIHLAERHGLTVIEDTTYGFTDPRVPPSLKAVDTAGVVAQVGTFSKICLPGVRVGYVVAGQPYRDTTLSRRVASLKNMTTVNTPAISQAIVAGMVLSSTSDFLERSAHLASIYRRKRQEMLAQLSTEFFGSSLDIAWSRPHGGFFIVMRTPWEQGPQELELSATRYGVIWTPMRGFYSGHQGDTSMRLSFSVVESKEIKEGVRRLGEYLRAQATS